MSTVHEDTSAIAHTRGRTVLFPEVHSKASTSSTDPKSEDAKWTVPIRCFTWSSWPRPWKEHQSFASDRERRTISLSFLKFLILKGGGVQP